MSRPAAVRAWRPAVPGVREVFHARFAQHAYPRHTHDVWTVLIVDHGDIRTGLTLQDLGDHLGASRGHLVRSFTARFGVPPHAYLLGRRIDLARSLLLEGRPAAAVAVEVGFHDQPHLTRHFVRHVGTTPGRYATSARRG